MRPAEPGDPGHLASRGRPRRLRAAIAPRAFLPKYTFDSFVIGSSNRFSHAAALAVAEAPGQAYNPLLIHGGTGLGKTHLLQAIGQYVRAQHPDLVPRYVTSETFTNEFVEALRDKRLDQFKQRYRARYDVLLVDDVQFLGGKERIQEEFFHTFNTLYEAGKQVVLTCDRPVREMGGLEQRLRSRFEWGLTDRRPAPRPRDAPGDPLEARRREPRADRGRRRRWTRSRGASSRTSASSRAPSRG